MQPHYSSRHLSFEPYHNSRYLWHDTVYVYCIAAEYSNAAATAPDCKKSPELAFVTWTRETRCNLLQILERSTSLGLAAQPCTDGYLRRDLAPFVPALQHRGRPGHNLG